MIVVPCIRSSEEVSSSDEHPTTESGGNILAETSQLLPQLMIQNEVENDVNKAIDTQDSRRKFDAVASSPEASDDNDTELESKPSVTISKGNKDKFEVAIKRMKSSDNDEAPETTIHGQQVERRLRRSRNMKSTDRLFAFFHLVRYLFTHNSNHFAFCFVFALSNHSKSFVLFCFCLNTIDGRNAER
jgi:hypothetical protein